MPISLHNRFQGAFLGLAVGDALGGKFEAQTAEHIRSRIPTLEDLLHYPTRSLWYTDDTQMMIGVAETLIAEGEIIEEKLCAAFVENYMPSRGYGRGARAVLEAMEEGRDYRRVGQTIFPGGSYGNGAAMRVAPIGLLFRDDPAKLQVQATASALPTHSHPLGIEGAVLLAQAVGIVSQLAEWSQEVFLAALQAYSWSDTYAAQLDTLTTLQTAADLMRLGNGIAAQESVVTAIGCFMLAPQDYDQVLGHAIFLGGDTDTIAAMAGALSGALLGIEAIPSHLIEKLEQSPKGGKYIFSLADKLYSRYQQQTTAEAMS